ncbi:MAG: pentapeptide repeat-containing protein, partial [Bdellovibrionales bacterium]|nr:pentapeptide repeat-containing protein [Bdellovibrionales bacterium]
AATISNAFFDLNLTDVATYGIGVSATNPGSSFSSWDSSIWTLSASAFPRLKYFDSPRATSEISEPALTPSLCSNSAPFDGGQGTRSSPFLISTAAQLQNLHCNPQASFRLTSDIDMSGKSYSGPLDYSGQFDGAGHTISNLTIPRVEGVWKTGLFDSIKGGIVKDLSVQNATVTGNNSVGIIVGHAEKGGVVLRCRSSGSVTVLGGPVNVYGEMTDWGPGPGGGLVGSVGFSIVAESSSSANVTAAHRSGGLVGQAEPQAMIWDSSATGQVNCNNMCAALAGVLSWNSSGSNSYALGGGNLIGLGGGMEDSYMNPSSADTLQWDPEIWEKTLSMTPQLRSPWGVNFSGTNLAGLQLRGANLSGINLSGANLSGADLQEANLTGVNLSHANLSAANMDSALLAGADLREADLRGSRLYFADLSGANLRAANLQGVQARAANFTNTNLSGVNLSYADLVSSDFSGSNLTAADFYFSNMPDLNNCNYCATRMNDGSILNPGCEVEW